MSDSEIGEGVPLIESDIDSETAASLSRKRKREDVDSTPNKRAQGNLPLSKQEKKKKQRQKSKLKKKAINNEDLDDELNINRAYARMDSQLLADHINQRTRLYGKDLSSVELDEKSIPARSIKDTSDWDKPRTLENAVIYLKQYGGKIKPTPDTPAGAPRTIFITASGIRAADAVRAFKSGLPKEGIKNPVVAKLFAKHIKLAESIAQCSKYKMDIGIGTPQRISELLDNNALSTVNLERLIIDVSHIDQKKRGILDMRELHEPLIKLLRRKEFQGKSAEVKSNFFLFF